MLSMPRDQARVHAAKYSTDASVCRQGEALQAPQYLLAPNGPA